MVTGEICKTFKVEIMHIQREREREGETLPSSVHEASNPLIPKPDKDMSLSENHKPVFFKNIDAKIFHEILANYIQQYIQRIIYHYQVRLKPEIQGWITI